jgi:hypothetical protein
MKTSISLPDDVAKRLDEYARGFASGNASLVVDVALRRLFSMPMSEVPATFWRDKLDRMALTRQGWRQAFCLALARLKGTDDRGQDVRIPRQFGDAYVVILPSVVGEEDGENDPFYVHMGPIGNATTNVLTSGWTFERTRSPIDAAKEVAEKLP